MAIVAISLGTLRHTRRLKGIDVNPLNGVDSELQLLIPKIQKHLAASDAEEILGRNLSRFFDQDRAAAIVDLILRADILRVTLLCLYADGSLSDAEIEHSFDLTKKLAAHLGRSRPSKYGQFANLSASQSKAFFTTYFKDNGPLGFGCLDTKWRGLAVCKATAHIAGDDTFERFTKFLLSLAQTLIGIDGLTPDGEKIYSGLKRDLEKYLVDPTANDRNDAAQTQQESPTVSSSTNHPANFEAAVPESTPVTENLNLCPDCSGRVSPRATTCPHCGCPLQGKRAECRITVYRVHASTGSARRTAVHLDGNFVGDFMEHGRDTFVVLPGTHCLTFYGYSLLSGEKKRIGEITAHAELGDHFVVDFSPYANWSGFGYDLAKKLD